MEWKDVGHTVGDLARVGLLVGRRVAIRALADERAVEPGVVSELVGRVHPQRIPVRVTRIVQETPSTKTFRLVPHEGPFPPFRAGQFVTVFVEIDGVRTSRAYTISSSPTQTGHVDITVRRMTEGFVSHYLCDRVEVGQNLELAGPAGCFFHDPVVDSDRLVMMAGGCGITPFMSIIRQAAEAGSGLDLHLIYGSRVPDDVIFGAELERLASEMANLRVDVVISEPPRGYKGLKGFLDARMVGKLVGEVEGRTFFVCGPHAMYTLCLKVRDQLGIPARRFKRELSGPPPEITAVEGWPKKLSGDRMFKVRLEGEDRVLEVRCGEPLLNSLERNGLTTDTLCRSGECGVCRIRLIEGEVFMPPTTALKKSDAVLGYIHPCVAHPTGDITIRL